MLTTPVTITGNIAGAYAMRFKIDGVEGDVDLLSILQYLTENGGGQIYINSDWVIKGAPGITVNAAIAGVVEVNVPKGKALETLQSRVIDAETELDEDGNMTINIDWNTSDFNQGYVTALTPFVTFLDSSGNQLTSAELGITVNTTVSAGITSTTIIIAELITIPFSLKILF